MGQKRACYFDPKLSANIYTKGNIMKDSSPPEWVNNEIQTQNAARHPSESSFIERLIAGLDDVELTPRELALLEAYLKQPISMAQIQREKRAEGESQTLARQNKLKLIRDFNRNLPAANELEPTSDIPTPADSKPKRPGRRKADFETIQREAQLAADWEQARETGVYKGDFAKEKGMTVVDLDKLLDRVAARKRRCDKKFRQ